MKADPKVARVVADAHLFDALRQDPGWKRLYERVMARKETFLRHLAERMMGPKSSRPSDEEIAFHQGFYHGGVFVVSHPEHAERNLERAARIAWLMVQEEQDKIEEESPYAGD